MKSCWLLLVACLMWLPGMAMAAEPVAGVDYELIDGGKPYAPLNGKVEVAEVFAYPCIHCAHFEPIVSAWARKQPSYVRFTPVPAGLNSSWVPYARAYYAAQLTGVLPKTHDAVFKALHESGTLPARNATAEELTRFYASYGVNASTFNDTLRGPKVDALMKQANDFVMASGIRGTPTLVINGKYRVTGGKTFDDVLQIADYLVAKEHGRAPKTGKASAGN
ncbi:thiol:disulfide interchange protein DsbA/DsbL [Pseudoxanthomonas dokdonensis]|uniref:Thiol:disulfide interchange protein n=1 Tax=Pseudoxanthomonas dokdonensis TaxID=344882 RepID=A0A0R0CF46_9GAMM|nr:thiol:disulfide interchange protein DsbA/DsbL [Pseudoxanthomonas dokdonensis]KRG68428.1 hypothetical protein ABB29_12985 [Pseudoxanthomonas dokdonensis]